VENRDDSDAVCFDDGVKLDTFKLANMRLSKLCSN